MGGEGLTLGCFVGFLGAFCASSECYVVGFKIDLLFYFTEKTEQNMSHLDFSMVPTRT